MTEQIYNYDPAQALDDPEAILETIYLFSNLANAAHLNESLAQLERGEVVTVDYDRNDGDYTREHPCLDP